MVILSDTQFTRGTAEGVEAEDIVLLINCTSTEKLLGTDISATNHGLPQGKHENEVFRMFIWDGWQTVWLQAAL